MSAFIMDSGHVLAAVIAAKKLINRVADYSDIEKTTLRLINCNIRSVNHRYNERYKLEKSIPHSLISAIADGATPSIQAYKWLNCLEYQSCEKHGYYSTKDYQILVTLRDALASAIICNLPSYDAAQWG